MVEINSLTPCAEFSSWPHSSENEATVAAISGSVAMCFSSSLTVGGIILDAPLLVPSVSHRLLEERLLRRYAVEIFLAKQRREIKHLRQNSHILVSGYSIVVMH